MDRIAKVHIVTIGIVIVLALLFLFSWFVYHLITTILEYPSFLVYLFLLMLTVEGYWVLYSILKRKLFEET